MATLALGGGFAAMSAPSAAWVNGSWINGPGGWVNRPGGWINGPASWVNRPGGWINSPGWVNRGGSWINGPGGWINSPGGWVNRGGSWVNGRRLVNGSGGGTAWVNRRGHRLGEPIETHDEPPAPILSVPVRRACKHPTGPLVLRVGRAEEAVLAGTVPPGRIAWIETTVALAATEWPTESGLDLVLTDPARDAPLLYDVARLRHQRPLRVTIECVPGVATAARIAMALQVPVRLPMQQPTEATVAELAAVLDGYLHDPRATAPVEFFHSALARRLHGTPLTRGRRSSAIRRCIGK